MKIKYHPKKWVEELLCFIVGAILIITPMIYQSNVVANEQKEKDLAETRSKTND